ncbi:class I SAM-dependent methyltransferase [Putridiphycobacter roseus]|nr:class I SAM-dependent methyltransferase [Putridiphycobacter roseus]
MRNLENSLGPIRKELLGDLEGNILDVGSGTGVNFEYFSPKANVIAVEPSKFMLDKSELKLPKKANITTYNIDVTDKTLDNIVPQHSLDYIICTLVLCTIPDQKLALDKFKKWLKPSGKLIILEHIHAQKKVNRILQNMANPIWQLVGDGCNLNRDTDVFIKAAGFKLESEHYFKKGLRFYQAIFTV